MLLAHILSGCTFPYHTQKHGSTEVSVPSSNMESISTHTYSEISHLKIFWSEIFKQKEKDYFVYFYSETCSHCRSIKNHIIEYALDEDNHIYFVSSSPEITIDEEKAKNNNVDKLTDLAIRGYPSLIKLSEKIVMLNVAGVSPILEALKIREE